jgi:hypothetical protein
MLKGHQIALGFLVATAFWAVILLLQSEPSAHYQICETNQYTEHESCAPHHLLYVALWYVGYIINPTSLTALATIAIAWFTWTLKESTDRLWLAGIAQSDLARQEFTATHRPRVILRYIQGPFLNDEGHRFIWITFVNTGANDAIITAFGGDLAQRGSSKEDWAPPGLNAGPQEIEPIVLACGQRHFFTVTAKTSSNTDQAIFDAAIGPGFQVCAVGTIRYRDSYGVERDTGFFRVLDDEGASFVVSKYDTEMEYQD